ncbi:GyrI-like domain-containing protein [Rhizobium bangladeshense]|uniref:GyrI-like domain-containing protein n=1 Tax=Rhizobium bangladeshense TaxID=1138189 RepID=UPI000AA294CD|nr:GyrI-like domain-containing protein [Rhizobium bangladeshense]
MLTLPTIIARPAVPYVAVKRTVTLPFDDEVPSILGDLFDFISARGLRETGPVHFKHNVVVVPELEMEFAVPVDRVIEGHGSFVSGILPAGRHAEITYFGPYDDLLSVNGVLIGWASHAGLVFDARPQGAGEWFAGRYEIYHNSPAEEPDPQKLKTTVSIKLKD